MLVVVLAASASAQLRVTGRVIDLQNKPVGDVIVKLMSGTKTLAYGSTNAKGEYVLEVKSVPSGTLTLQFNHISYEKETSPLPASPSRGGVVNQDMVLTPKAVTLKEV
ncbi:MAG: carboxypeptidase regulatory-like domain-containing protein, partial [Bacteroidaceae bacterium]|nr:carboxypeptidase regulatory-like domain-containing protein [Bacteroidaceae bacterium]